MEVQVHSPTDSLHEPLPTSHNQHQRSRRSDGVLTREELARCRAHDIALAYDPVQIGWIRLDSEDDISGADAPRHRTAPHPYTYRRWRAEDAAFLARTLSSPRLWRYLPETFTGAVAEDAARALIDLANESDHHLVRAVEFGGAVIGQVRLDYRGGDQATAEISYWLAEPYWGQGHASSVVARFVETSLRRNPQLKSLIARVHTDNHASERVLKKAGFVAADDVAPGPWRYFVRVRTADSDEPAKTCAGMA